MGALLGPWAHCGKAGRQDTLVRRTTQSLSTEAPMMELVVIHVESVATWSLGKHLSWGVACAYWEQVLSCMRLTLGRAVWGIVGGSLGGRGGLSTITVVYN